MVPGFAARARDPEAGVVDGPSVEPAESRVVIPGDAGRRSAFLRAQVEGVNSTGCRAAPALSPANRSGYGVAIRVSVEIVESAVVSL
jgi:hypothetical protein